MNSIRLYWDRIKEFSLISMSDLLPQGKEGCYRLNRWSHLAMLSKILVLRPWGEIQTDKEVLWAYSPIQKRKRTHLEILLIIIFKEKNICPQHLKTATKYPQNSNSSLSRNRCQRVILWAQANLKMVIWGTQTQMTKWMPCSLLPLQEINNWLTNFAKTLFWTPKYLTQIIKS